MKINSAQGGMLAAEELRREHKKMKIKNIFIYVFLFLLTALVLDLANPLFDRPPRDGGFFLYAGGQILDGKIPYQDFWDSKGPGIFYINAVGLFLGNGSRWGVWLVEFIFIFFTFFVLYHSLLTRWNSSTTLLGITCAGFGLKIALGYGNYTEEYALLFNVLGLALFFSIEEYHKSLWKYFWVGILFGVSFTFRANNIGGLLSIFIAVFIYFFAQKNKKELIRILLISLSGFAVPLLLWFWYFAFSASAWDMIYASILFNFLYTAAEERELLSLFVSGFGRYGMAWVAWVTLLAWLVFVWRNFSKRSQWQSAWVINLFFVFWFPVEILLSNLSGRDFSHYYISWALAVAFYNTMLFDEVKRFLRHRFALQYIEKLSYVSITIVLIISLLPSLPRYIKVLSLSASPNQPQEYIHPISQYIQENTQPTDLVLTWYPDMGINFMAERTSPVKYVYYPLFLGETLTSEIENEYISDLTSRRPALILDCSREVDAIPSLDVTTRKEQFATPGLRSKMYIPPSMAILNDFVKTNYFIETKIEKCIVFRLSSK
jgi:hypothetical protein